MSGILRLESLTKGNTLKQGDKTALKYRLCDADGEKLNIAGKSAKVRLVYPDFLTIGYEKDGLTVAQDDTVTFTIDNVIPSRIYHVEIIVDDKFIFPSRADESKFTVDKSSLGTETNIIEVVGVDAVVRKAVDLINDDPGLIIDEDKLVNDIINNSGIGSIEEYHQKFNDVINFSSNIFDTESVVIGHAVDLATGELTPRADYNVTELIETSPDVSLYAYGFNAVVFYDANKNRIGSLFLDYTGGSFVTRPLTKFIRLRYQIANQNTPRQINIGTELLPFEPYGSRLSNNINIDGESLEFKSITSDKYADKSVSENAVSFLSKSSNLFDKRKVTAGVVSVSGAYDETNSQYVTSDFIAVEPNEVYSHTSLSYIGHYDKNKNFIKRIGYGGSENGENTLNTDATTYFLRGSINTNVTSEESAQINQGNILLPYDNFGYVFNDDIVGINNGKDKIDLWEADPFIIEGITEGFYHGDAMVGYAEPHTITKEQVISWYDNLNPHKKSVLATDDVGNDIYGFEFKSPEVPTAGERRLKERKPKMILVSGFHGLEKAGVFNLYNAMKAITQDWRGNELLETLRFNVDFIIVPIVNPYGFDNLSRQNENGVDLSRNFPDDWDRASSNPEDITYRGTSPLSEPGARAISDLLKEHQKDAILFMSHHNYGTDGTFVWNASGTKMQVDLAKKLIAKLSREWQKENSWLPQEDDWFAGYADTGSPYGSEGRHAAGLGIQGSTFEISHTFPFEDNANQYSEATFTFGIEVMVNWLLMNLKENTKFYNSI